MVKTRDLHNFILLFQSEDRPGISAKISDFIFRHKGNIINADQYTTDPEKGNFFMRVEFDIDKGRYNKDALCKEFNPIARSFNGRWNIRDKKDFLRMGIFVSTPGHCLNDLLYLYATGELRVEIPFVASTYEEHRNLVQQYELPYHFIAANKKDRKEQQMLYIAGTCDFLVLARYMLVLSKSFLRKLNKDIINIHHGFLPSFKGADPYHQALDKGVKVIGATAHFVIEKLDEGPIISQQVESVSHKDDLSALIQKGKNLEKRALSDAVLKYVDYKVIRDRNKTIVF